MQANTSAGAPALALATDIIPSQLPASRGAVTRRIAFAVVSLTGAVPQNGARCSATSLIDRNTGRIARRIRTGPKNAAILTSCERG